MGYITEPAGVRVDDIHSFGKEKLVALLETIKEDFNLDIDPSEKANVIITQSEHHNSIWVFVNPSKKTWSYMEDTWYERDLMVKHIDVNSFIASYNYKKENFLTRKDILDNAVVNVTNLKKLVDSINDNGAWDKVGEEFYNVKRALETGTIDSPIVERFLKELDMLPTHEGSVRYKIGYV